MSKLENLLNNFYEWIIQTYSYKDKIIIIWCNHSFTFDYLDLYLAAYLDKIKTEDESGWEIKIIVDDKIHESIEKNMAVENNDYSGYKVVFEATGCITAENKVLKKRWHISRKEQNNLGFVQDIYCWIRRTLIEQISEDEKMALFHGACVSTHGEACLVLGDKGMGKSYVANHLMYQKQWSYIAADQTILIENEDGTISARGNITSYRLEEKDLDLYAIDPGENILSFRKEDNYVHKNGKTNLPPVFLKSYFHTSYEQNVQLKNVIILNKKKYDLKKMKEKERVALITKYVLHDSQENSMYNMELENDTLQYLVKIIIKKCNVFTFSTGYSFKQLYECLMTSDK